MKKIKKIETEIIDLLEKLGATIEEIKVMEISQEEKKLSGLKGDWIEVVGGNGFLVVIEEDKEINVYDQLGDHFKSYKNMKAAFKNFLK